MKRKIGLRTKLYLVFGSLMILVLLLGLIAWRNTTFTQDMYSDQVRGAVYLANAESALWQLRYGFPQFMVLEGEARKKIIEDESKWYKEINENIKLFTSGNRSPEEKQVLKEWDEIFTKYIQARPQWFELFGAGKIKEAAEWRAQTTTPYGAGSVKTLRKMIDLQRKIGEDRERQVQVNTNRTKTLTISLIIFAFVIGSVVVFFTVSITKPINRIVDGLSQGIGQVASASVQVSLASQSLAQGASEQAAGVEQTSASIEEMASMTKQNADNATQANTLMKDTSLVVDEANQAMKDLTWSMTEITTASEETGKIIKTIDEIAFQTNLLALNAAVEAARAGEAGAGFAVVADEVRNLAMRAAEAAKNTSSLIEGTVKKIKNGSDIVGRTNEAFEKVAGGSKKVSELVGEIAAASQEQSQGIGHINKAVSEMEKVIQKNAANAEESASASEEMRAQAEQMKGLVTEVVVIVGGNGNGFHQNMALSGNGSNGKRELPISHHVALNLQRTLPKPGGNGKSKKPGVGGFKEIRPEQVLPMQEGEFKEF